MKYEKNICSLKKIYQIEPVMDDSEKKELLSVIDSGWFTEAKKTKQFEKMFSKFTGSRYACAVTSGTAGLYLALNAMGIKSKDEVIVPDLTFIASPTREVCLQCIYTCMVDRWKRLASALVSISKMAPTNISRRLINPHVCSELILVYA